MAHLTEDELLDVARDPAAARYGAHVSECPECLRRVRGLEMLAAAGRTTAAESMAEVVVPDFERVRAALPQPDRAPNPRSSPWRDWRWVASLVLAQLRLVPASVGVSSVLGFACAVALAVSLPGGADSKLGVHVFGIVVALVVLMGTLSICSRRRDPRAELLFALPVSPATVFVCRLVGVLGIDLLLAVGCSGMVVALGGTESLSATLASWFGQALLTSGVGLVFTVGRAPVAGGLLGGLVWALGSASVLPGGDRIPLQPVFQQLWSSSPAVIAVALVLVVVAVLRVRAPWLSPGEPSDGRA